MAFCWLCSCRGQAISGRRGSPPWCRQNHRQEMIGESNLQLERLRPWEIQGACRLVTAMILHPPLPGIKTPHSRWTYSGGSGRGPQASAPRLRPSVPPALGGTLPWLGRDPPLRFDDSGLSCLYMVMRRVKIAELKARLSEHLRAVENGAEVVVTDRDRPIARIVPLPRSGRRARVLQPRRAFSDTRDRRRARAGWAISSTKLLLEERRER